MQAHEIMDCQDLVNEIDYMAQFLRSDHVYEDYADFDAMAKDLDEAANKLANLVERFRLLWLLVRQIQWQAVLVLEMIKPMELHLCLTTLSPTVMNGTAQ